MSEKTEDSVTRRGLLRLIGAGAVASTGVASLSGSAYADAEIQELGSVEEQEYVTKARKTDEYKTLQEDLTDRGLIGIFDAITAYKVEDEVVVGFPFSEGLSPSEMSPFESVRISFTPFGSSIRQLIRVGSTFSQSQTRRKSFEPQSKTSNIKNAAIAITLREGEVVGANASITRKVSTSDVSKAFETTLIGEDEREIKVTTGSEGVSIEGAQTESGACGACETVGTVASSVGQDTSVSVLAALANSVGGSDEYAPIAAALSTVSQSSAEDLCSAWC